MKVLYEFFMERVTPNADAEGVISFSKTVKVLHRAYRIRKSVLYVIVKDMVKKDYFVMTNCKNLKINNL